MRSRQSATATAGAAGATRASPKIATRAVSSRVLMLPGATHRRGPAVGRPGLEVPVLEGLAVRGLVELGEEDDAVVARVLIAPLAACRRRGDEAVPDGPVGLPAPRGALANAGHIRGAVGGAGVVVVPVGPVRSADVSVALVGRVAAVDAVAELRRAPVVDRVDLPAAVAQSLQRRPVDRAVAVDQHVQPFAAVACGVLPVAVLIDAVGAQIYRPGVDMAVGVVAVDVTEVAVAVVVGAGRPSADVEGAQMRVRL